MKFFPPSLFVVLLFSLICHYYDALLQVTSTISLTRCQLQKKTSLLSTNAIKDDEHNTILENFDEVASKEDYSNDNLDSLLDKLKGLSMDELSADTRDDIESEIRANSPSDIQIRLGLMGFTPLTYAGYLLAAAIIFLNNVLGNGWAGDMIGLNAGSMEISREDESEGRMKEFQGDTIVDYEDIDKRLSSDSK